MPLSNNQIRHLRGLAHPLRPVVMVGQHGMKDSIMAEVEIALDAHELIKLKISVGDREARDEIIQDILAQSGAELVQRIGNTAILFRRNPDQPKVALPSN